MRYKVIFEYGGTSVYEGIAEDIDDKKLLKHINLAMHLNTKCEVVLVVQQKDGSWQGQTLREEVK